MLLNRDGDFDAISDSDGYLYSFTSREAKEAGERSAPFYRRTISFLGHVIDELRRVQWPNRQQTIQGTAVTLGFVIIAGGYLGLLDAVWKPLIELII